MKIRFNTCYIILFFAIAFQVAALPVYATSSKAFSNLDSATTKINSARAFLANGPFDYNAADNNLRKARIDITKAQEQAGKGSPKLSGAKLKTFEKDAIKLLALIDSARKAVKSKLPGKGIMIIDKSFLLLEKELKRLNGTEAETKCDGTLTVDSIPGVPDVYITHSVGRCPFIFDEVIGAPGGGEIGSLSYGYSNDGRAGENDSSCSQNNIVSGTCIGIPGRPGGYYRMRMNLYLAGGPPTSTYLTFKRNGVVVAQLALP